MNRTLLAVAVAATLAGCAPTPEQAARQTMQREGEYRQQQRVQAALNRLPPGAVGECEMRAQMADINANHGGLIYGAITSALAYRQMKDTCLTAAVNHYGTFRMLTSPEFNMTFRRDDPTIVAALNGGLMTLDGDPLWLTPSGKVAATPTPAKKK